MLSVIHHDKCNYRGVAVKTLLFAIGRPMKPVSFFLTEKSTWDMSHVYHNTCIIVYPLCLVFLHEKSTHYAINNPCASTSTHARVHSNSLDKFVAGVTNVAYLESRAIHRVQLESCSTMGRGLYATRSPCHMVCMIAPYMRTVPCALLHANIETIMKQ